MHNGFCFSMRLTIRIAIAITPQARNISGTKFKRLFHDLATAQFIRDGRTTLAQASTLE